MNPCHHQEYFLMIVKQGCVHFMRQGLEKEIMIIILVFICLHVMKPYLMYELF